MHSDRGRGHTYENSPRHASAGLSSLGRSDVLITLGGRLLVHDFMVNDSLDGPALGALWALQHVTVNADGLGLCPAEIISRMASSGFDASKCESLEMIHGMTKLVVAYK